MTRRTFLWGGFLGSLYPGIFFSRSRGSLPGSPGKPTVISTWSFGKAANEAAMKVLRERGSALDAVEAGARTTESDPAVRSVGYGGLPDAQGEVTLDACIMDFRGNAGSVAFLRDIKHPVSVARQVMEKSDHVMLVGEGAKRFALAHGFKEENLLTKKSRDDWLKWKSSVSKGRDAEPVDSHDTVAILAQDREGNLAGACSSSGLAYKMHGRVGDSPIIGAGLYCDNGVGAVGATGRGEAVMKTAGSFLVVELMRQGLDPGEACKEALQRILEKHHGKPGFQVAYIALRVDGKTGAAAVRDGFKYALSQSGDNRVVDVEGLA